MIKTNISFKANFKIAGAEYFTIEEWQEALKRAPKKADDILDFIFYMNSEQSKQILNRFPKEDTIELHILDEEDDTVKIKPYLYYRSANMDDKRREELEKAELDGTWIDAKYLKSRFRVWTNKLDYFFQTSNKKT